MHWQPPSITDFKQFFARDFFYATDKGEPQNQDYVMDSDISKAISTALIDFNQCIFGKDPQVTTVFLYLAAFYLVASFSLSEKGLASQSKFPINSKTVAGVAVAFTIPQEYLEEPLIAQYAENGYGMMYLKFALPKIRGNVAWLPGTTTFG